MNLEKKNIFLKNTAQSLPFEPISASSNKKDKYPKRDDYKAHAAIIRDKLQECIRKSTIEKIESSIIPKSGIYLEFHSAPGFELATDNIEQQKKGIKLLNIQNTGDCKENIITKATIFIPSGNEAVLFKKIDDYASDKLTQKGNHKNNNFARSIEDIKLALLSSFWIGNKENLPNNVPKWYEIWIRYEIGGIDKARNNFATCCKILLLPTDADEIVFPERIVTLIKANRKQLIQLIMISDYISEIRQLNVPSSFFTQSNMRDQKEWCKDLLHRIQFSSNNASICLLDTGMSSHHPLLSPAITSDDSIQTVKPSWGLLDRKGHGTEMGGIALYFDLKEKILSPNPIRINHTLESVKILPEAGDNDEKLYGALTKQAVSLAEIANPN